MAEIANKMVVEEDGGKESAEGKWMRYKEAADAEAGQLADVRVLSFSYFFHFLNFFSLFFFFPFLLYFISSSFYIFPLLQNVLC